MKTETAQQGKIKKGKSPGKYYRSHMALPELFRIFPDARTAEAWFETERWGASGLYCPRCGSCGMVGQTPKRLPLPYWCGDCRQYFSVRTGTVMERSKISYDKWAVAIFQYLSNLKGVSSMKLHNDLGITQKSAWFMLHRIREAYESESPIQMVGPVEIDEAYFGGKEANKHASKKLHAGRGTVGKTAVVGIKDRKTNEVRAAVVADTTANTLQGFAGENAKPRALKFTDESTSYEGLQTHATVSHSTGEYVRGQVHINGMESFWAMMKRAYHGTYHRMSARHLHRYVAEFAGRHNIREEDTIDQMRHLFASMIGQRLMYADLVGPLPKAEPEA